MSEYENLGFSQQDALDALNALEAKPKRDGRICMCGHSVGAHSGQSDEDRVMAARMGREIPVHCTPSRMQCPCIEVRPVIETANARKFLRRTSGEGTSHALSLGMTTCTRDGVEWHWIVDVKCDRCGSTDRPIPVALNKGGRVVEVPGEYNRLLCNTCVVELRVG